VAKTEGTHTRKKRMSEAETQQESRARKIVDWHLNKERLSIKSYSEVPRLAQMGRALSGGGCDLKMAY
jgi:hypothetical protein